MKNCIVDASVAVKWFFREEDLAEQACTLLQSNTAFIFPDYFYLEMNSVLTKLVRKKYLRADKVRQMNKALNALPADVLEVRNYRDLALELSLEMNIGYYDCLYTVPAFISKAPLITADKKLFHSMKNSVIAPFILWLGDYQA